ncbi:MFS transporter [Candidatus Halobonum tyrrellensis]|uniref:Major facilitator superfamily protein n=1 Tax=Candidatus Halobonum tyrrellensis G22 TaxID=1324957 RepID=V4HGS6_9EURY|nr:MFS transporter [Candidatus Halobonum tyrrellensis]ESP87024.1 major facilitator superfamily protein [Candidatus Halobonum tyrrellensis G22]
MTGAAEEAARERDREREVSAGSYVLLGLASAGYFLYTFAWFSLAAYLVPVMEGLGLSGTQAGVVTGAVQLSYVPLALVSGLAIDRLGSRRALGAGLFVIGVAHVLRGVATGFGTLVAATLLLGVGGTAVTFGLPKLVSELFPAGRAGSMSSVYTVGATLGNATVFAVARPLVDPRVAGWQEFFRYTGGFVAAFALVWLVVSGRLWGRVDHFSETDDGRAFTLASMGSDLRQVVTHRGLLLVVVVGTAQLFISHGLSNWLPAILDERGVPAALAGALTSAFVLVRVVGIVVVPALSDRYGTRRYPIMVCGVAGAAGLVGLVFAGSVWTLSASLALVGVFAIGGLSPLVRAIPIELAGIGPGLTAVATGLIFTVGEVGGFLGPFSVGAAYDYAGAFDPALGVLAAASLAAAVVGYRMDEPSRAGSGGTDRPDAAGGAGEE